MGFVARTIFWLGLVYSAMPLDFGSLVSDRPPGLADANPLAPCAHGVTDACRRRIDDLRKTLDAAAALGLIDQAVTAAGAGRRERRDAAAQARAGPLRTDERWPRRAAGRYTGARIEVSRGAGDRIRHDPGGFRLPRRVGGPLSLRDRARPRARAAERGGPQRREQGARLRQPGLAREGASRRTTPARRSCTIAATATSHLVRGLIAIAIALYSDQTPKRILATDAMATFRSLGLEQHLTPQRSNGVRSMIERIRNGRRRVPA